MVTYEEILATILKEGEIYLRNLMVPLTITLLFSLIVLRGIRNHELAKLRSKHRDRVIDEILRISHTFNSFLDMFHIRSKYNPQEIETLSEKLGLEISNLSGLSVVYFANQKSIRKLKVHLDALRALYAQLVSRKEPFQPVGRADYTKFQEDFAVIVMDLMKTIRHSKIM